MKLSFLKPQNKQLQINITSDKHQYANMLISALETLFLPVKMFFIITLPFLISAIIKAKTINTTLVDYHSYSLPIIIKSLIINSNELSNFYVAYFYTVLFFVIYFYKFVMQKSPLINYYIQLSLIGDTQFNEKLKLAVNKTNFYTKNYLILLISVFTSSLMYIIRDDSFVIFIFPFVLFLVFFFGQYFFRKKGKDDEHNLLEHLTNKLTQQPAAKYEGN